MEKIKEEIAKIGKRLYEKNLNESYAGNFSVRVNGSIYITPSSIPKDMLNPEDILIIDFDGNVLEGSKRPSSETLFHIAIYKTRNDVNAIIHAHPPFATSFSIAHKEIKNGIHEEATLILGEVPVVPYELTSTEALAKSVSSAIVNHNAILLANHGAITVGEDLEKAFRRMEELENICKMIIFATILGGVNYIPEEKLNKLLDLKKKRGL